MKIACPHCQTILKAPESALGRKARCKQCGETFRLTETLEHESLDDSIAMLLGEPMSSDPKSKRRDPCLHLYEEARRRDTERRKAPEPKETS